MSNAKSELINKKNINILLSYDDKKQVKTIYHFLFQINIYTKDYDLMIGGLVVTKITYRDNVLILCANCAIKGSQEV